MQHYIYKITLLCGSLKNHYYLGKHSTTHPEWKYFGSGKVLRDYYAKYGRKEGVTFIKEILEYNTSSEENFEREKIIIGNLWKTDPMCINLCEGGKGPTGHIVTDEARKKMSFWGGKQMSEETKKKMSESHKGVAHSEEHNKHVSESLKGRDMPWMQKPHTKEWNEHISQSHIGDKNPMYGKRGKEIHNSKPVDQYTKDGIFIKRWDCQRDILRELHISVSHICSVCNGKRKTTGGYIWKYAS